MKHKYLILFLLLGVLRANAQSLNTASGSTLYAHEFVLQTAHRRILHASIYDRGSTKDPQGNTRPRYLACVRYSTVESSSTYTGAMVEGGCAEQPGQVTASVELAQLSRELFVDKLLLALKPSQLIQKDGAGTTTDLKWQAALANLVDNQRLATSAIANRAAADKDFQQAEAASKAAPADAELRARQTKADTTRAQAVQALKKVMTKLEKAEQTAKETQGATKLVDNAGVPLVSRADILDLNPGKPDEKMVRDVLLDAYLDFMRQREQYFASPKAGVVEMAAQVLLRKPDSSSPKGLFKKLLTKNPAGKDSTAKTEVDTKKMDKSSVDVFYPDSLQMEIEDGQVTDLKTVGTGKLNGAGGAEVKLHFETYAPIGISSDLDLNRAWNKQRLWNQAQLSGQPSYFIRLNDLLRYYPILSPRAGDRSPANGVYIIKPNDPLPQRTLTKVATTKILQGRVFTDLAGVSGDKPNGLVQIEVDKKFVFGSPWSKKKRYLQYRLVGYFQPFVSVTKIEAQNRYLPLRLAIDHPYRYTVNSIDLLRYTNLRVGSDLNLLSLRFPRFMSDVSLDAGISLNRVDIRDSVYRVGTTRLVRVDSTLNVVAYGLSLKTRTRPDSRYGIQSRIGFYRYALVNSHDQDNKLFIHQSPNPQGLNPNAHTLLAKFWYQGIVQYELLGWVRLSEHSELFVRPQFSHLLYQAHRSFFQFQVGWQFDVFSNNREAPATPANLSPSGR